MKPWSWIVLAMSLTPLAVAGDEVTAQRTLPLDNWRLVTDGVMGGVSQGRFERIRRDGRDCLHLSGLVSNENNGGFIQIAKDLEAKDLADITEFEGLRLWVSGNGEAYNVHLRTEGLWFPWQAYRATFEAGAEWSIVDIPFERFEQYKTGQQLQTIKLKRIGIVAIGREFEADLCVAQLAFY